MKTATLLTIALLTGITIAFAAEPDFITARSKLAAKDIAAFDQEKDKLYAKDGSGVMARVAAAEAAEKGSGNTEMAKLYVEDKLTQAGAGSIKWDKIPKVDRKTAIEHIVAKETFDKGDLKAAVHISMKDGNQPELGARKDEMLGLLPKASIERYKTSNQLFNEGHKGNWIGYMKDQEILDVMGAVMSASRYDGFRKEMLARCVGAVTRTRQAANIPNDVKAFDAAMAPILTALNAPLWDGLPAAVAPYGMTLTTPDYTGLVEELTARCNPPDDGKPADVGKFAGSLAFWKGTVDHQPLAITDRNGKTRPDMVVTAAPLSAVAAKPLLWAKPHGTYMTDLGNSILTADAAGDTAERDRLFAIYQTWAEKYLNPSDTPTK